MSNILSHIILNSLQLAHYQQEEIPVFDEATIKRLKDENIYKYQENLDVPESLWDQFWNWVGRFFTKFLDAIFGMNRPTWWNIFIDLLPYLVIGLVIGLLIYLFIKNNPLRKPIKSTQESSDVLLHNLRPDERKSTIEDLIDKARKNKDYQLLIRYQYIEILNDLDRLNFIQFEADKTNSDYFYELSSSLFLNHFRQLTYFYEYAWYGNFRVNQEVYAKYEKSLQQLQYQLKK